MNMINSIAKAVFLLSLICSCHSHSEDYYLIRIYDEVSEMPIEGATVSISEYFSLNEVRGPKKTNREGMIDFKRINAPGTEYMVIIKADGYLDTYMELLDGAELNTGDSYNDFYLRLEEEN